MSQVDDNGQRQSISSIFGVLCQYLPVLTIKTKSTRDYIDYIKQKDVKFNAMTGIDCYERPFIVIKAKCINGDKQYRVFQTFFQRYSEKCTAA